MDLPWYEQYSSLCEGLLFKSHVSAWLLRADGAEILISSAVLSILQQDVVTLRTKRKGSLLHPVSLMELGCTRVFAPCRQEGGDS